MLYTMRRPQAVMRGMFRGITNNRSTTIANGTRPRTTAAACAAVE
jgi:hypothetical protein